MQRATKALEALGIKPNYVFSNGGLDANWLDKHGIPTVTIGAGQDEIHTIKEYVNLPEFAKGCRLGGAAGDARGLPIRDPLHEPRVMTVTTARHGSDSRTELMRLSPIAYTGAIIVVAVVLFVWNRLPVVVVAMATALALWATGVLTLGQALAGFGDPAVIFIASLFVVSAGLEMTGVTAWAGQLLIRGAGEDSRDAAAAPDDAPRRAAHRADQRQRRGRRAPAGRRGHRGPAEAAIRRSC